MGLFDEFEAPPAKPKRLFDEFAQYDTPPKSRGLNPAEFEPPQAGRTTSGVARDVGVTALKGLQGLQQSIIGLADLTTGGAAGWALERVGIDGKRTQQQLDAMYSAPQQEANRKVREADGFVDTLGAALENPSVIATTVGESVPQMAGGAAVARGVMGLSKAVAPWAAGAIGEGVMGGGSAAESIRQESEDGLLSGKQTLAALGSGGGTALFGAAGGKLMSKFGWGDIDTILARGGPEAIAAGTAKRGFIKQIAASGISEGVFEELPQSVQEQMWQNHALGKPVTEGVGNAAALGMLAGTAMGGAAGGYNAAMQRNMGAEQPPNPQAAPPVPASPVPAIGAPDATIVNNPSTKPGMFDEFEADATADPMNPAETPRAIIETPQPRAIIENAPGPRAVVETVPPRGIVEYPQRGNADGLPGQSVAEVAPESREGGRDLGAPRLPDDVVQPTGNGMDTAAGMPEPGSGSDPVAGDTSGAGAVELRDLTEGLIRQMRDAKQMNLDSNLRKAIDRIKAGGVNEKPAYFAKLAKEFEKRGDPKTAGMLGQVAATLKARQKAIPKPAAPAVPKTVKTGVTTADEFSETSRKQFLRMVKQMGGVSTEFAADITGEPANQANRILPGFFSTRGNHLDLIARRLHEAGYLTDAEYDSVDGGVERTRELLGQALAKEFVGTPDQRQTLAELEAREADAAAELQSAQEQAELAEILGQDVTEADFNALFDGVPDAAQDQADLAYTQEQENDAAETSRIESQAGEAVARGAAAREEGGQGQPGRAPVQSENAGQEARPALDLAQQTERDLAERERELNRREAEQNARERAALDKEKADRARDDFTLTGSDRASDANAGQGDIFGGMTQDDSVRVSNDIESLRRQLIDIEDRIVGAAGMAPGFVEDAMKSRKVDAALKAKRNEIRDRLSELRKKAKELTPAKLPGTQDMAQRQVNASEKFIESVVEQFGLTRAEAGRAWDYYVKNKLVKVDAVGGQYSLKDGRMWDGDAMRNAAAADQPKAEPAAAPITEKQSKTVENFGETLPPARRAMAAKLDESLTDKETDSGIALFRRSEAARDTGPVSQVELDSVIERVAAGWKRAQGDGGRLIAVESVDALPVAILRAADAQNVPKEEIKGVFHNGHIYLVRENHATAQDAEETIFHEAYGHMGALLLNGNDRQKLSATFNDVWRRIDGLDGVRKMAGQFDVLDQVEPYIKSLATADMPLETKRRVIVDELLAHVAGRGDFTLKEQAKAYIGALRVGLRNAARAMKLDGIAQTLDAYTDSELLWNLKQMRAAVVSGATGKGNGTLFARRAPAGPNSPQQPINLQNRPGFNIDPETAVEQIQRKHQDRMNRWAKVQRQIKEQGGTVELDQDVYHAMERMTGRAADRIDQFTHETVRPLLKRIADLNTNFEELGTYLMALGAKDRNDYIQTIRQDMPDNGSGLSNQEAAQIIADYRKRPDFAKFDALARDFQKLTERKLKVLVGGGVISQQQATDLTQAFGFYVPFKGFETIDEDGNRAGGTGAGYSTPKRFTKQAFGRVSKAGQVVENIIRDYEQAVILAEKANVGRYVRNLAQANPDNTLWTVDLPPSQPSLVNGHVQMRQATFDNENEIRFIEGGKEVRIQLHDPLLAQTYNNLGQEPLSFLMKAGDTLNRFLRQTYTQKNPAFILVNGVRDVQTGLAVMTAEMGATAAAKAMRHMAGAWKASSREAKKRGSVTGEWAKYMDAYRKSGAQTAYYAIEDIEAKQTKLHELMAREGGGGLLWAWKQHGVKGLGKMALYRSYNNAVVDVIESLNSGFENMMRLAAFRQYIDDHGGIGSPSRETLAEASRIAKNLTVNFNRKGEKTRGLNALYLFWNPNVQGTQNLYRAAMSSAHKGQVRAAIGGMVGLGFLMAMATDEDDDELTPGYLKDTSIVIHAGDGKRIQIPLAYGLGAFVAMGYEVGMLTKGARTPIRSAVNLLATTLQHFSPLGNPIHDGDVDSKDLAVMAMPTILKVPTMIATNRNSFGYDVVPKFDDEQPDRPAMRNATRGGVFDKAAGGLEYVGLDVSPESLKLTSNFLTGGLGTFLSDSATGLMSGSKGQFEAEKMPIMKRFYGENDVEEYRSRFYEQANDVKQQASAQGKKQKEFFGSDKARDSVMDYTKQMKELREKESAAYKADKFKTAERLQTQQIKLSDAFKREHDRMVRRGLIEQK